jgi:hypothetical protein
MTLEHYSFRQVLRLMMLAVVLALCSMSVTAQSGSRKDAKAQSKGANELPNEQELRDFLCTPT